MIKKIIIIIFILLSGFVFFKVNEQNYSKHNEIRQTYIKHPENLQTKQSALISSFWFKNLLADVYWLRTVQYIWWNAFNSDYKKYLFTIMDLVTELNPYFEHPYIIWQLLLPSYQARYENLSEDEQEKNINQAITLWLKWVKNFCDANKIDLINNEADLYKIWNDPEFKNPCLDYKIPYYLAYIYYYYDNNPIEAAKYYKIASAVEDGIEWSKIMAAIMQWKWWDREKAFFMFLTISKTIEPDNFSCNSYADQLNSLWVWIFLNKQVQLDWELLKAIEETREKYFSQNSEDGSLLTDTKCSSYINKAIRELNLSYIEYNNKVYKWKTWKNSINAKQLFDDWYLDYLPVDFQKQEWSDFSIIYTFNEKTWNYDYGMWRY